MEAINVQPTPGAPPQAQGATRGSLAWILDQYVTVLGLLAVIAVVTYIILIQDLESQEGSAAALNLAGEQRTLVERGGLLTFKLGTAQSHAERQEIRQEILEVLTQLENTHGYLRNGNRLVRQGPRLLAEPGELAPEMRLIYFDEPTFLDRQINTYIKNLHELLSRPIDAANPVMTYFASDAPDKIRQGLDKVVAFYQQTADFRLQNTQNLQGIMLMFFIGALVLGGTTMLRPMVLRLKDSMAGLQAQRDFNDNIIHTAQALIIGLDPQGRISLFSRYAQEVSGWLEEEIRGENFFARMFAPEQQETARILFEDVMQGGLAGETGTEIPMLIRSDELVDIVWHATVVRDAATRQPVLFLITGNDISERKRAENRLQATLAELEKLSGRMQDEINLAASLQRAILPDPGIVLPGLAGTASLTTSSEVGGDYYDYWNVGGHYAVVMIGDVSGHGVAAGTMVSAAKAGTYPLVTEGVTRPAEILRALNQTMLATAQQSLLMTMGCASLDSRTGHLRFANAGHVLPYLKRRGESRWTMIEAGGLPLGKSSDSDYLAVEQELTLEIGDRLFFYTDGVVEQESSRGEPFGYERLEAVLDAHAEAESQVLERAIMEALRAHSGKDNFDDDVTIALLEHTERVEGETVSDQDPAQVVRVSEDFYRRQSDRYMSPTSRQLVVFMADDAFDDLLPRLSVDGIRRVLPRDDTFCYRLGWDHLLGQHRPSPDDDLRKLLPGYRMDRQFQLTHSDDKLFLMEESRAWLEELGLLEPDHLDSILIVLDEMVENSLYGAPRDGQSQPFYTKGTTRSLDSNEEVQIALAVGHQTVGLSVIDNWGTLTPAIFLDHLTHTLERGIEAGVGGAGLYLMWRMSDYLQVRVTPHRRTQITTLWDLNRPLQIGLKTGFQFLYHSEYDEVVSHDVGRFSFH